MTKPPSQSKIYCIGNPPQLPMVVILDKGGSHVGNWRRKWLRFTPEPGGAAPAVGAHHRGAALSGSHFVGTQSAHLSPVLVGSEGPRWGLALASLSIAGPKYQVSVVPQNPQASEAGVLGESPQFARTSVTPTSQNVPAPLERGNVQKGDWAYKVERVQQTYSRPTGSLPLLNTLRP